MRTASRHHRRGSRGSPGGCKHDRRHRHRPLPRQGRRNPVLRHCRSQPGGGRRACGRAPDRRCVHHRLRPLHRGSYGGYPPRRSPRSGRSSTGRSRRGSCARRNSRVRRPVARLGHARRRRLRPGDADAAGRRPERRRGSRRPRDEDGCRRARIRSPRDRRSTGGEARRRWQRLLAARRGSSAGRGDQRPRRPGSRPVRRRRPAAWPAREARRPTFEDAGLSGRGRKGRSPGSCSSPSALMELRRSGNVRLGGENAGQSVAPRPRP